MKKTPKEVLVNEIFRIEKSDEVVIIITDETVIRPFKMNKDIYDQVFPVGIAAGYHILIIEDDNGDVIRVAQPIQWYATYKIASEEEYNSKNEYI